jgi:hypothetical protein
MILFPRITWETIIKEIKSSLFQFLAYNSSKKINKSNEADTKREKDLNLKIKQDNE